MMFILGLILFVCLVIVHEYGHYRAAKAAGVTVEEFGIGFPPKLFSKKLKDGMPLSINLVPLGGFVRLKGEHDADNNPGSYGAASDRAKTRIMLSGVLMNLLVAFGILALLSLVGMPKLVDNQFQIASDSKVIKNEILAGYIEPDSPASSAGIKPQDRVIAIGAQKTALQPLNSADQLPDLTKSLAGQQIIMQISHGGKVENKEIQLRTPQEVETLSDATHPKGYLGISPTNYTLVRSTWSAPIVAAGTLAQFAGLTFHGLGSAIANLFSGNSAEAAKQVTGPIGIVVLIREGANLGIRFILMITAVISLTLAIMNLLPIPALDGGKLFVTLLHRVAKKPLHPDREDLIHGIGFALLIALVVLITFLDIKRAFFGG